MVSFWAHLGCPPSPATKLDPFAHTPRHSLPPGWTPLAEPPPKHAGTQGRAPAPVPVPVPKASDVNQTTYSPVGARAATGSWLKTGHSSLTNAYGPVGPLSETASTTREFRVHDLRPQWPTISDAHIQCRVEFECELELVRGAALASASERMDPPQVEVDGRR